MRLFRLTSLPALLLPGLLLLAGASASCSRQTVSFNSQPDAPGQLAAAPDSLTTTADSAAAPSLGDKRVALTKEQERAARAKERAAQRKPKKKKNVFLNEPIKKGYTKKGPKGKKQEVEIFYYLRTFKQPDPMALAVYYYNPRKRKIFKAAGELDPATDKVMHGPYKMLRGGKVVETGSFAYGTRHLRWEKFTPDNILVSKTHYERGFPRDANVTYYDADHKQLKEVVPYLNGQMEGDYVRFLPTGKREWEGQFENGKRVGEWINYWGFRNLKDRRHYVLGYGESGYEPEVKEPVLLKEYNRNGVLIYEKDKLDNREKGK
ncbi:toxin-antitoxin system YwqK family antitoxin [Hymenobacter actinosclerus]|uniref:Antitoxin component YwqK of the YwqJK toxin-antitoxin module n=1 Tax=Hymenobacter actinosclerus TaxID=82805 RepID=A0A1H9Z6X0_9BACT|nr:hypothetical protein [Hymenobacter actinosclerus]SES77294.1 Antitoxin component YwqK of the YwqJK toxin-antitoxin module [Hymenobacter actinosclerus]